ncbi:uncharacterized protein LOC107857699 [Capsicum annuum]|uniref:uncharacterized protein LOC107857699 n=1 Tax=Capsicum annuum TaxID=4072 RepID=UPI0007BFBA09|nr:uncharacterized protein LOC107857699 [Capsicum annuum]
MDELTDNIKTHELKKQQRQEKKEAKTKKSLAMKALKSYSSEEDKDAAYLSKRILRAMNKSDQFKRRGSNNKKGGNVEVCHKCRSPKHFIKNCPMYKLDYQEYLKSGGDKG